MNDQLDRGIRQMLDEVVRRAPTTPAHSDGLRPSMPTRGSRRPALGLAAALLIVVAGIGGALIANNRRSSPSSSVAPTATTSQASQADAGVTETAATTAGSPTSTDVIPNQVDPLTPSTVTVFANNSLVRPTLLASSSLPAGLVIEDGGTTTSTGAAEVELATPDRSATYRIQWQIASCNAAGLPSRAEAIASFVAPPPSMIDGRLDLSLQWCDGRNAINVFGTGSTPASFLDFVGTVSATTDSSAVSFISPPGMQYRAELTTRTWSALSFRDGNRVLLIKVTSALDGEFPLSLGPDRVEDEPVTGTGRFTAYRTADQPSPQLALVYDSNTIVFISGENISDQELAIAAAGLEPADPALAPPISNNCDTFGAMCG